MYIVLITILISGSVKKIVASLYGMQTSVHPPASYDLPVEAGLWGLYVLNDELCRVGPEMEKCPPAKLLAVTPPRTAVPRSLPRVVAKCCFYT